MDYHFTNTAVLKRVQNEICQHCKRVCTFYKNKFIKVIMLQNIFISLFHLKGQSREIFEFSQKY